MDDYLPSLRGRPSLGPWTRKRRKKAKTKTIGINSLLNPLQLDIQIKQQRHEMGEPPGWGWGLNQSRRMTTCLTGTDEKYYFLLPYPLVVSCGWLVFSVSIEEKGRQGGKAERGFIGETSGRERTRK